ncbi:MAG TPA: biotin/lipoate A/B protein ligase family protein [Cyclobacteriaceae bacterium]
MSKSVWRYIEEHDVSAAYGLASDEKIVNDHVGPHHEYAATLKLYTYRNYCALSGRFQDLSAEIDLDACKLHGFDIGRRLTGGGAIIMGENQLGICLATHSQTYKWEHIRELYHQFSEPILEALQDFDIHAQFRSKNDLEVAGKKIAGLGIYVSPEGGIQFHTSLLLDLDVAAMLQVLKLPVQKFSDKKMVHSIEQRMTTVRREANASIALEQLKQVVLKKYQRLFDIEVSKSSFSPTEKLEIEKIADDRYRSDEWLYQLSPQQDMDGMSLKKTAAGMLRTYIALKGENIKSVLITGDFMEMPIAFSKIESRLKWSPLDFRKIENVVIEELAQQGGYAIKAKELTGAIWLAAQRAFAANKYTYKGSCYYPKVTKDA